MFAVSDQILCVSESVADQFHPRVRKSRIRVLHNGIPRTEFPLAAHKKGETFRKRHHLDDHFVVGVAGRIKCGRKGQDVVVRAARRVCPKFPRLKFVFVGVPFPGNEAHLENLKAMVREFCLEDRVVFAGESEDMPATYSAFDVSLMPSALPEPFGNVVAESMAMRTAVIATRIGGIAEQVEDGKSGLLVEPNDPDMLAAAIERLLNDEALRHRLEENGWTRYLEKFEFEGFYAKLLSAYADVRRMPAKIVVRPPVLHYDGE
jgi:glycosyltransferase involved in cell wall biosynthesis